MPFKTTVRIIAVTLSIDNCEKVYYITPIKRKNDTKG